MKINIEKRNEILDNWTIEEGSSMNDPKNLSIIIDSMKEEQSNILKTTKIKNCRIYRGHLLDLNIFRSKKTQNNGDKTMNFFLNKLSSWTKSKLSATMYCQPNGYQGNGKNKIPFVFHTMFDFRQKLGLDLECLSNYTYYKNIRTCYGGAKNKLHTKPWEGNERNQRNQRKKAIPHEIEDTCSCNYTNDDVKDKDREVILYNSDIVIDLDSLELAYTNLFEEEITLTNDTNYILNVINDESIFYNESSFKVLWFKNLIFHPERLPKIKKKLHDSGLTDDMIAKVKIYVKCRVIINQ